MKAFLALARAQKRHLPLVMAFGLLALLFLVNSLHTTYPDEFDNLAGGRLILKGQFPYSGFFTHHAPAAYFLAAFINLFSGSSFVNFRLIYAIFLTLFALFHFLYLRRRFTVSYSQIVLALYFLLAFLGTYNWSHMLLADSLSAFLLLVPYSLLFYVLFHRQTLSFTDLAIISITTFLVVLTSFTYIYAVTALYLITLFWYLHRPHPPLISRSFAFTLGLFLAPPLVFLLYLVITGSLSDFIYQSLTFNTRYYVYFPDNVTSKNPVRIAVVLFRAFFLDFRMALVQVKDFNLYFPFSSTFALANTALALFLVLRRRWWNLFLAIALIVYVTARSNVFETGDTDYQAAPYHFLSLFHAATFLYLAHHQFSAKLTSTSRLITQALFLLTSTYLFFFSLFIFDQFTSKAYTKYMGQAPLIYDRPKLAPTLNQLLMEGETYYIGPFAFEEHYYTNATLASNIWITIPAMDQALPLQQKLLTDLKTNQPPFIFFDHGHFIFNAQPGQFLRPFLESNYLTLSQLQSQQSFDVSVAALGPYDLASDLYLHRDSANTLLDRLESLGLISRTLP